MRNKNELAPVELLVFHAELKVDCNGAEEGHSGCR